MPEPRPIRRGALSPLIHGLVTATVLLLAANAQAEMPAAQADDGSYTLPSLVTDTRLMPIPQPGTYPAKGKTVVDSASGMHLSRVADKSDLVGDYGGHQSSLSTIVYARYSPANTTGEFVLVHGDNSTSAWVYRTATNRVATILRFKPSLGAASRALGEVNELRWDYSGRHPYRLYFVGRSLPASQSVHGERPGMSFYRVDIDPATGQQGMPVVIRDFSADFPAFPSGEIMNDVEGDSSHDSRRWAWMVMDTQRGNGFLPWAVFSYDKAQDTITGRLQRSCQGSPAPCRAIDTPATPAPYLTRPNMVEMSPTGARVVVHFERAYAGHNQADIGGVADGPKAFQRDFSQPVRIGADATHSGWAWSLDGRELFVSQNNRNDWIEAVDIRSEATARCVLISDNSYGCGTKVIPYSLLDGGTWTLGMHFSRIYDRSKRGWLLLNTYDSQGYSAWGKNQNLLVQINDGTLKPSVVARLGSSANQYYDYRSEGSGAFDFQGNSIWTTGNWGFTDGRGDVFRIRLPDNWFELLPKP